MSPGLESRAADTLPAGPHSFVWTPEALTDIYREGVNLCVWRRGGDAGLSAWLSRLAQGGKL